MFDLLFNQKFKVMKNLMQKLVKAILCIGVVSVSLIACESDTVENNIIDLDQIDDQIFDLDSLIEDTVLLDDAVEFEPIEQEVVKEDELKEME